MIGDAIAIKVYLSARFVLPHVRPGPQVNRIVCA